LAYKHSCVLEPLINKNSKDNLIELLLLHYSEKKLFDIYADNFLKIDSSDLIIIFKDYIINYKKYNLTQNFSIHDEKSEFYESLIKKIDNIILNVQNEKDIEQAFRNNAGYK
jgi:hypothetical protein